MLKITMAVIIFCFLLWRTHNCADIQNHNTPSSVISPKNSQSLSDNSMSLDATSLSYSLLCFHIIHIFSGRRDRDKMKRYHGNQESHPSPPFSFSPEWQHIHLLLASKTKIPFLEQFISCDTILQNAVTINRKLFASKITQIGGTAH